MDNWLVVVLHTKRNSLLKRVFETALPDRTISIHAQELNHHRYWQTCHPEELLRYFRRQIYDPSIWRGRVLTIYGAGDFHHYTYALSKLAAERRGLDSPENLNWTYFHFDHHRDDWGGRFRDGTSPVLNCASFVDSLVAHHGAIPFFVGPDVNPCKDVRGYQIQGRAIPIYSNYFTKAIQKSRDWRRVPYWNGGCTGGELPSVRDLRATPTESYISLDLDLLTHSEMVTNFDQNEWITTRRVCQIIDRIRDYKRVFSADILGLPESREHSLSALTVLILAKKLLGLGTKKLLDYHTYAKRKQALLFANSHRDLRNPPFDIDDFHRRSPIEEEELMEVIYE